VTAAEPHAFRDLVHRVFDCPIEAARLTSDGGVVWPATPAFSTRRFLVRTRPDVASEPTGGGAKHEFRNAA
jgi:hypothetical protein